MRSSHQDPLSRWLDAERDGRTEDAEAALLELFAAVPRLAPPAGFADRVLLRAGLAAPAAPAPGWSHLFASRWVRALLVLCPLAIGVSMFWLPQLLQVLGGLWGLGDLVQMGTDSVVEGARWLGSLLGFWELFLTIARALATPLATTPGLGVVVVCLLVSLVAFRFLRDLITRDRSWTHVESI